MHQLPKTMKNSVITSTIKFNFNGIQLGNRFLLAFGFCLLISANSLAADESTTDDSNTVSQDKWLTGIDACSDTVNEHWIERLCAFL